MPQKQLLQSAGDGTAVPAGYVGEVVRSTQTGNSLTTTTGNTWIDGSGAGSITLTAGKWLVTYKATARLFVTGTGQVMIGNVALFSTETGTQIADTISTFGVDVSNTTMNFPVSGSTYVSTNGTVISFNLRNRNASNLDSLQIIGSSLSGPLSDPDAYSGITAVRIA